MVVLCLHSLYRPHCSWLPHEPCHVPEAFWARLRYSLIQMFRIYPEISWTIWTHYSLMKKPRLAVAGQLGACRPERQTAGTSSTDLTDRSCRVVMDRSVGFSCRCHSSPLKKPSTPCHSVHAEVLGMPDSGHKHGEDRRLG